MLFSLLFATLPVYPSQTLTTNPSAGVSSPRVNTYSSIPHENHRTEKVTYEVKFGFIGAGELTIEKKDSTVVVKGKSGGMVGWFYHYKLYMVYNLKNPSSSYMKEVENKKRRYYDFKRILKKKPWLPVVVQLLLSSEGKNPPEVLKVGNLTVRLAERRGNDWLFIVEGSKKVKWVILRGWVPGKFPEEIEISGKDGTLTLVREG